MCGRSSHALEKYFAHDGQRHDEQHHSAEDGHRRDALAQVALGIDVSVPDGGEGDDHKIDCFTDIIERVDSDHAVFAAAPRDELDVLYVEDDGSEEEASD